MDEYNRSPMPSKISKSKKLPGKVWQQLMIVAAGGPIVCGAFVVERYREQIVDFMEGWAQHDNPVLLVAFPSILGVIAIISLFHVLYSHGQVFSTGLIEIPR